MLMLYYASVGREKSKTCEKGRAWKVNTTYPGYMATGMNGLRRVRKVDTGAINAAPLAILGLGVRRGLFHRRTGRCHGE